MSEPYQLKCTCGHRLSHHAPDSVGRFCEITTCECVTYTPDRGEK